MLIWAASKCACAGPAAAGAAYEHGDVPENAGQINEALAAINPLARRDIIALGTLDAMLAVHRTLDQGSMVGVLADHCLRPGSVLAMPLSRDRPPGFRPARSAWR